MLSQVTETWKKGEWGNCSSLKYALGLFQQQSVRSDKIWWIESSSEKLI